MNEMKKEKLNFNRFYKNNKPKKQGCKFPPPRGWPIYTWQGVDFWDIATTANDYVNSTKKYSLDYYYREKKNE